MSYSASSSFRRFKVFSTRKVTMQVQDSGDDVQLKKYWLVESDAKSNLTIRPLDEETWLPTGRPNPITVRELQKRYNPEPGMYEKRVQPNLERYASGMPLLETPPVQEEAPPVLDEAKVTEDFKQGLALLERGDVDQAKKAFTAILNADEPFEEEHKHLFNDFAIQLRKNNLHSEAIAFYTRAIELSWGNEDENLHINLARVMYAEKQYGGCVQHLFDALRIAPGHSVARSFLAWLQQQKLVPKQYALQVKGYLAQRGAPNDAAEAADATDVADAVSAPDEAVSSRE